MVLVCYMTLQDQVLKALHDFIVWSSSRSVTTLPGLVVLDTEVMEIQWF